MIYLTRSCCLSDCELPLRDRRPKVGEHGAMQALQALQLTLTHQSLLSVAPCWRNMQQSIDCAVTASLMDRAP